ncbi:MAG: hypothetical protein IJP99_04175 [Methanobrevibacter sp.]|nr:hypothetical protein [Methanobrevibacter sp.]
MISEIIVIIVGTLLLLHKSINASLNDLTYEKKLKKYCSNGGNIYSESLRQQAYENNSHLKIKINKLLNHMTLLENKKLKNETNYWECKKFN